MKIRIGFFGVLTLALLFITHSFSALACVLSAVIHEIAHILTALIRNIRFKEMRLSPFGAALIPEQNFGSFFDELLICASGPFINLTSAFVLYFYMPSNSFAEMLFMSSFFLGALNLLPIYGFDGGRIIFLFLEYIFSFTFAKRALGVTSFVTVFALWSLSLYFIVRSAATLSLFVFSCSLFSRLFIKSNT